MMNLHLKWVFLLYSQVTQKYFHMTNSRISWSRNPNGWNCFEIVWRAAFYVDHWDHTSSWWCHTCVSTTEVFPVPLKSFSTYWRYTNKIIIIIIIIDKWMVGQQALHPSYCSHWCVVKSLCIRFWNVHDDLQLIPLKETDGTSLCVDHIMMEMICILFVVNMLPIEHFWCFLLWIGRKHRVHYWYATCSWELLVARQASVWGNCHAVLMMLWCIVMCWILEG